MAAPELLFSTPWLALYRRGHWDYVRRPQAETCVGILAITPEREIILVEQFRIPLQRRVIEIPAGIVGDEPEFPGESIAETARRELLEETGYRAETMKLLAISPTSSGMSSEYMHLFHAENPSRESNGGGTHSEDIQVHHVPLAGLRSWLADREKQGIVVDFRIHAALSLAGISV
ncbi:MAG: NUDIX hydrolase [Luteolibacter sp.]